jgi:hypothetical protein
MRSFIGIWLRRTLSAAALIAALSLCAAGQEISQSGYWSTGSGVAKRELPWSRRYGLPEINRIHRLPEFTGAQPAQDKRGRTLVGLAREVSGELPPAQQRVKGGYLTRWAVVSPSAQFVRARLTRLALPPDAQVFFVSLTNPQEFYGPFDGAEQINGALWSPPAHGEGMVVELFTREAWDAARPPFRVSHLMHGYRDPLATDAAAGPCQQEVPAAWADLAKATGLLDFVDDMQEAVCSGTLLSNQSNDQTPFFLTAGQCLLSASSAQSARVYWNYLTGDTPPAGTPFTDGASIISGTLENDFALLRLTGTLPAGLVFSGWNNSFLFPGLTVSTAHHPSASRKRFSAGRTNTSCPFDLLPLCLTFTGVNWTSGTLEQGSDGAGLWTGTGAVATSRLVGVAALRQSSCAAPTANDFYSRFSAIYPNISTYMTTGGNAAPPNNNFSAAITGNLPAGLFAGANARANKEAGEPNHGGNAGGASVWYRWTAPADGPVTVSTAGSDYDTLLGVYTGASVNSLNTIGGNDDAAPGVTFSQVAFNAVSGTTYFFAVDGKNGATGTFVLNYGQRQGIEFRSAAFVANEGQNAIVITVDRTDTTQAGSVDYFSQDNSAEQRSDYTIAAGRLNFAAGESTKTFAVLINDDAYAETAEVFNLTLVNPVGGALGVFSQAAVSIADNDTGTPTTNPIDGAQFFVRQHYSDFLNREPDIPGLDYWTGQIAQCGANAACVNGRRIGVSAAFYIELEFQETGNFVYRLYQASFGQRPLYDSFMPDRAALVGGSQLEQSKQAFALAWVQSLSFAGRYPVTMTAAQYVDALLATIQQGSNVNLTGQRQTFINEYNSHPDQATARARALRLIVDAQAFQQAEFNKGFVLMQYFGYLRRDPDQAGYDFWLAILNQQPQNARGMVCAFITSAEYQQRYSSVVTRANDLCAGNP